MFLLVNRQESRSSSGSGAKYSGNSCMIQGSVGRVGNKIYFLAAEPIALSQWMGQILQYVQLETGWWEAL